MSERPRRLDPVSSTASADRGPAVPALPCHRQAGRRAGGGSCSVDQFRRLGTSPQVPESAARADPLRSAATSARTGSGELCFAERSAASTGRRRAGSTHTGHGGNRERSGRPVRGAAALLRPRRRRGGHADAVHAPGRRSVRTRGYGVRGDCRAGDEASSREGRDGSEGQGAEAGRGGIEVGTEAWRATRQGNRRREASARPEVHSQARRGHGRDHAARQAGPQAQGHRQPYADSKQEKRTCREAKPEAGGCREADDRASQARIARPIFRSGRSRTGARRRRQRATSSGSRSRNDNEDAVLSRRRAR